ncbi:MAG: hypothetical protein VKJ64_11485 [Leptolyngbyaceae bacterium]|nr:hypothetical protein [Leptolyngbyaceae bacterium]
MKFANPLYYPIAVLAGSVVLVVGVRLLKLPNWVVLPSSVAVATLGAAIRKGQEPEALGLDDPALEQELGSIRTQAATLAQRANDLRTEASHLLTDANQMELLSVVQYACDRAEELPRNIEEMARRMKGSDSLLSQAELQRQLQNANAKAQSSTGVAKEQWEKLASTLEWNISLSQEGKDARQAQVVSLSTLIVQSAGVLQQLQNKLRTADLSDRLQTDEVRSLSDTFNSVQENLNLLVLEESS